MDAVRAILATSSFSDFKTQARDVDEEGAATWDLAGPMDTTILVASFPHQHDVVAAIMVSTRMHSSDSPDRLGIKRAVHVVKAAELLNALSESVSHKQAFQWLKTCLDSELEALRRQTPGRRKDNETMMDGLRIACIWLPNVATRDTVTATTLIQSRP
jgi:hypothetical protein